MIRMVATLTMSLAAISSCGQTKRPCSTFPNEFHKSPSSFAELTRGDLTGTDEQVLAKIELCYKKNLYPGSDGIRFDEVRVADNGRRFIVFDVIGVTDIKLLFEVNSDGNVGTLYELSTF